MICCYFKPRIRQDDVKFRPICVVRLSSSFFVMVAYSLMQRFVRSHLQNCEFLGVPNPMKLFLFRQHEQWRIHLQNG